MRLFFLLSVLGLVPAAQSAGVIMDADIVANPCQLTTDSAGTCLLGVLVEPTPGSEIPLGGSERTVQIRGVIEREGTALIYVVGADGTLTNEEPYTARAGDDGAFRTAIDLAGLDDGAYRIVAYFQKSRDDQGRDDTFFQLTGTPPVTVTLDTPAQTTEPPTDTCDITETFEVPGLGTVGKLRHGGSNTLYLIVEGETDTASLIDAIRAEMSQGVAAALPAYACQQVNGVYDEQALTDALGTIGIFREERDKVVAEIGGDCGGLMSADTTAVENVLSVGIRLVDALYPPSHHSDFEGECDGKKVYHLTGSSPLVFVSSDSEREVAVRPARPTYSAPRTPWRLTVGPHTTTAPLYYEFHDPGLPVPGAGWSVRGEDAAGFLREKLLAWGYEAAEIEAFLRTDIIPNLPESPYAEIRVIERAALDTLLPLVVTPRPDRIERLLFHISPAPAETRLPAPDEALFTYIPSPGLSVRELGAIIR